MTEHRATERTLHISGPGLQLPTKVPVLIVDTVIQGPTYIVLVLGFFTMNVIQIPDLLKWNEPSVHFCQNTT